ncbi:MAG: hypothetical protein ABI555_03270 [Chloroflexota bacterium]
MTNPGPDDIAYWLEAAEGRAWADMFRAIADQGGGGLDPWVDEADGVVTFALKELGWGFFNRSIGLGMDRPATEADVDRVLDGFSSKGQTDFTIQIGPSARPAALEAWLEARGLRRGRRWAKVWRDAVDLPGERTELRIERVGVEQSDDWARVVLAAFEMPESVRPYAGATLGRPDWHHFLAYDGDLAVGAGGTYLIGEVAWLGFGATLESHRGRGSQSAIFARRMREAAALGVRLFITETGEDLPDDPNPSYRNMLRGGFHLAYQRRNWLPPMEALPES